MSHDCRATLCEAPHYANDTHRDGCLCDLCHEHDWREWNIYPDCDGCLNQMAQWIHENTDFEGCPLPDLCTYSRRCRLTNPTGGKR